MRLTRFNNLTKEYEYHLYNPNTSMVQDEIAGTQKLGQLEDIEEELGIDLIKLLSARKVYYMDWNRNNDGFEIKETYELFINLTKRTIEYYPNEYSEFTFDLELKDYGKNNVYGGWALTKEELL